MKKGKSKFAGKIKRNAQETKSAGGAQYGYLKLPNGISVFSPPPGERVLLDHLPYIVTEPNHPDRSDEYDVATPGSEWWKRPFRIHRNIGSQKDSVVCPGSIGKRCSICEYRTQMIKEGKDKAETDSLKVSFRNLYVVVPLNDKKQKAEPCIMDISHAMYQKLLAEELEEGTIPDTFPDLEEGCSLRVRFDEKTIGSSKPFAEASRFDEVEREPYPESIMKKVPDLDKVLAILDYQTLERKFLEIDDEPESQEPTKSEEELAPPKYERKRKETAEEESEPPKRTPRKKEPEPEPEPVCVACEGSGKNSKGGVCRPCRGTGKPRSEKEPEPEKKDRCPFGHRFGIDTEGFPKDCDNCDLWDDCMDEKEK